MGFSTDAIHAGQEPDPSTGAIIVPLYQTSTYVQEELGKHKGYEYARTQNPTRTALEANIAALEKGRHGISFASGMAAINALLTLFGKGDHIIVSHTVYGGTYRLFEQVLRKFGLDFAWVDTSQVRTVEQAIREETRLVLVESPTNPLMRISNIREISKLCHREKILLAVDNTFLSPYLQRPLQLGADVVIHSTTKFLNGHSDSVGGILVVKDAKLAQDLYFLQNAAGAVLSPFDAWLVLRGTKTLAVRMKEHEANGRRVADFLKDHPAALKVYYPGLESHPEHLLAKRQQDGFGSMISFDTGSLDNARAVLKSVRLCSLAESLGGVETLISHPATMTHASIPPDSRRELGITDGLVRISVGIEDCEDLIADLAQALDGN
ncbi:MAG: trans-sulfuration enzyme family protein [Acidobacteriota bacterium]